MNFFDGFIKAGIKTAKQTLKNEIEKIYNKIDENDEKVAEKVKEEIIKIPKSVNYFNVPKTFHDEIQKAFNVVADISYLAIDKTDDVALLLKNIFSTLLGV